MGKTATQCTSNIAQDINNLKNAGLSISIESLIKVYTESELSKLEIFNIILMNFFTHCAYKNKIGKFNKFDIVKTIIYLDYDSFKSLVDIFRINFENESLFDDFEIANIVVITFFSTHTKATPLFNMADNPSITQWGFVPYSLIRNEVSLDNYEYEFFDLSKLFTTH